MDVISTKVNLVIEPVDGFTGERQLQGAVFARMSENTYAMKKNGCFVFFNKQPGSYKITLGGSCYQPLEFNVELDDSVKTMTVELMPSRNYKFANTVSKLYGKAEGPATVCFIYDSEQARILGEYKQGDVKISAFFSKKNAVRSERRYYIGKGEKGAVYILKHLSGMEYELDRPLEFDVNYDSSVGISYEITPHENTENENYFIAVNGSFKRAEIIFKEQHKTLELLGANTEFNL